ncbi:MAG: rRNA methyltransferase [Deltaproteobacteria bacterium]|nr:rRNA methyltransferase [Deltaproteobacteria bacterium]
MVLDNVTLVLHRPSSAENIGAVARVMRNFGLRRLVIVAPPAWGGAARSGAARTGGEDVLLRARRTARKAAVLLEGAAVVPDLAAALGGSTWACGTSSRAVEGRPRLSPRDLAAEAGRRSLAGPVSLVFGEERRGLSDAELTLCQAVCSIPTHEAYDSMNLAQAAAVLAYELALAGGAEPPQPPAGEPARHATVEALFSRLAGLLAQSGYLNPQNPEAVLAEWRQLLARAEPTQREVELVTAGLRALGRRLGEPGPR